MAQAHEQSHYISVDTAPIERDRGLWIKRALVFVLPVLIILGTVITINVLAGLKPEPEKKDDVISSIPVLTRLAVKQSFTPTLTSQGEVRARTRINLAMQVGGKVSYVSPNFIEGAQFKKGETLIQVEDSEYRLRVTQANANVAQAQTALIREESEADIARQDWADLGEGEASPLTLREPQIAEAMARLAAAQASADEAKLQLSRTRLSAPFTGSVEAQRAGIGEFIAPGIALGQVYAIDKVEVRLPLTDQQLGVLGLGIGFRASKDTPSPKVKLNAVVGNKTHTWLGEITRTDSRIDPQTRVLFAYAEVNDPYGAGSDNGVPLAPGLFVTASLTGQILGDSYILPRDALRGENQIYVARADDSLEIRTVDVAYTDRDRLILSSGLSLSDKVIISPVRGARTGMRIKPTNRLQETQPDGLLVSSPKDQE